MNNLFRRPKLGLTLGGGGARGGAHIGVLRVLRQIGYQPDIVVGSSIGALVAAMVGANISTEEMERIFKTSNIGELIRPARHGRGLLDAHGYAEILTRHFGNADLRDLTPKVAITATDIRGKKRVLIDEGPVVKSLLASTAVPGLFAPVQWDNLLLVDGGVLDNVPTQNTYHIGADYVVAVDVGTSEGGLDSALDNVRTFSKQLYRALYWLLNLSQRQTAFEIWMESAALSHYTLSQYHLAMFPPDVLIQPEMPGIGLFSMECIDDAIAAGERAALAAKPQILKLKQKRFRQRTPNLGRWPSPIRARSAPQA